MPYSRVQQVTQNQPVMPVTSELDIYLGMQNVSSINLQFAA